METVRTLKPEGHELEHLHWLDVTYSFKLATQLLKLVPGNMFSHAKAVLCAHVVTPAAHEQKGVPQDQIRCPFCGAKERAHFHHLMWQCLGFVFTRPLRSVSIHSKPHKDSALANLLRIAGVRASILEWRHEVGTQNAGC